MGRLPAVAALTALLLSACDQVFEPGKPDDLTPPVIALTTPETGTDVGAAATVQVAGRVVDADTGIASVKVNGIEATVAGDTFAATIPVQPGITMIVATATNGAGLTKSAARGVMAGETVSLDSTVSDGLHVAFSEEALDATAQMAVDYIAWADLTSLLAPMNPIYSVGNSDPDGDGDCLYLDADITALDVTSGTGTLTPAAGQLTFAATLEGISGAAYLTYSASCIDGEREVYLTVPRMTISATIVPVVQDGTIQLVTSNVTAEFEGAMIDVGGLSQDIIDLFGIENLLGPLASYLAESILPDYLNETFAGLSTASRFELLGEEMDVQFWPTAIDIRDEGVEARVDSRITVVGARDEGFVPTPHTPQLGITPRAFGLDVAMDVVNQALAGFWAAGGITRSLPYGVEHDELGVVFDTVELSSALPPFASVNYKGEMQVAVADLRANFLAEGSLVARASINATIAMTASFEGGLVRLAPGKIDVYLEMLNEGVVGGNTLSAPQFEAMSSFAAEQAIASLGGVLESLPLPGIAIPITQATVAGNDGYLSLTGMVE